MVVVNFIKKHITRALAIIVILTTYGFATIPEISGAERKQLASQFAFEEVVLPPVGELVQNVRNVNPQLKKISAWLSSIGASVALNDFDGDGLANDVCLVDPRTNQASISPVPGTGNRYNPIILRAPTSMYDDKTMAPMGCVPGDFNEDGKLDALVYYWGRTPIIFIQGPDGYLPVELTSSGERWYTATATTADLDGDGHVDIVLGNYFPDGSRILGDDDSASLEMQISMSNAHNGGSTRFFLWNSNRINEGLFREAKDVLSKDDNTGWKLAVGAADLDGDLLPEIYLANDYGPDALLHNRSTPGHLKFARLEGRPAYNVPKSKTLGFDSFKGMGVDFSDINGDLIPDIFVSNIASVYALEESHFAWVSHGNSAVMRNNNVAPYVDESEKLGIARSDWSWDAKFADFNNDGIVELVQATGFVKGKINRWPELQELGIANDVITEFPSFWTNVRPGDSISGNAPNPFYVRTSEGRFVDLAHDLKLDAPQVSRGIATADVDGDGDLDFIVANQWEPSRFYRNDCPHCGAFLDLRLMISSSIDRFSVTQGIVAKKHDLRSAIGAEARVRLRDGRVLLGQVDGGNGHNGRRSPELFFGLGNVSTGEVVEVEIRWRDLTGIVCNRFLKLKPGNYTIQLGHENEKQIGA